MILIMAKCVTESAPTQIFGQYLHSLNLDMPSLVHIQEMLMQTLEKNSLSTLS